MTTIDDAIFLLNGSGDLEKVPLRQYDSEALLQSLIEKHPELLSGDQIDPDEPVRFILIKREAGIPDGEQQGDRWAVDHLLLDQNAVPTFVETKRSSDSRIRREIVGQMLDYAANAQRYWPSGRIRSMATSQYGGIESLDATILKLLHIEPGENTDELIQEYWSKVEENLNSGNVRLIFIADKLPAELRRIIEFLNEQMERVEVLGIELTQYVGSNFRALVPRIVGQTEAIRQKKQGKELYTRHTTMQQFLDSCSQEEKEFFTNALTEAEKFGMQIYWGIKGFSLRIKNELDKSITLFYGFPPGSFNKNTALIQGYVGFIEDINTRKQILQRFLAIPKTSQGGNYTVNLYLNKHTLSSANKLLQEVFNVSSELSQGSSNLDQ